MVGVGSETGVRMACGGEEGASLPLGSGLLNPLALILEPRLHVARARPHHRFRSILSAPYFSFTTILLVHASFAPDLLKMSFTIAEDEDIFCSYVSLLYIMHIINYSRKKKKNHFFSSKEKRNT